MWYFVVVFALLIGLVVCQGMYVLYRALVRPFISPEADHLQSPLWKVLLTSSFPLLSAVMPCHWRCSLGHSLNALQHFLLLFLMVVVLEAQLQPRTVAMEMLAFFAASLVACTTQPLYNTAFSWHATEFTESITAEEFLAPPPPDYRLSFYINPDRDNDRDDDEKKQKGTRASFSRRRSSVRRKRSVLIIAPEDEEELASDHSDMSLPDIASPQEEETIDALYEDSDGDTIPAFPFPQATAAAISSEETTGSTSADTVMVCGIDADFGIDFGGALSGLLEEEFAAHEQHDDAKPSVFALFDALDNDDEIWNEAVQPTRQAADVEEVVGGGAAPLAQPRPHRFSDKLLLAVQELAGDSEKPKSTEPTTAGRSVEAALQLFDEGVVAQQLETGVGTDGKRLVLTTEDFEHVAQGNDVTDEDAFNFFDLDDDKVDGTASPTEQVADDAAALALFVPDDAIQEVATKRQRPNLPDGVMPPEYLKHLVDQHTAGAEGAAVTFLDEILHDESFAAHATAEELAAVRARDLGRHHLAVEGLMEDAFSHGREAFEAIEREKEERIRKALEPEAIEPWIVQTDGVLIVETLRTRQFEATIALAAWCVVLLICVYAALNSVPASNVCDGSRAQHYWAALLVDILMQAATVAAAYSYQLMIVSDTEVLPSELHPYSGQQRALCRRGV